MYIKVFSFIGGEHKEKYRPATCDRQSLSEKVTFTLVVIETDYICRCISHYNTIIGMDTQSNYYNTIIVMDTQSNYYNTIIVMDTQSNYYNSYDQCHVYIQEGYR
jgi:hypothetical protein